MELELPLVLSWLLLCEALPPLLLLLLLWCCCCCSGDCWARESESRCRTRELSVSRLSLGNGEFWSTRGDGVVVAVWPLLRLPPAELDEYGVVANGMEDDVELRLVFVLSE